VDAFKLPHALRIVKQFNESSGISNKLFSLGFSILLLRSILLAFRMLILWVVELIEKAFLVHVTFLDLL
jgi:hypothetical protein